MTFSRKALRFGPAFSACDAGLHVPTFERLTREIAPELHVSHLVDAADVVVLAQASMAPVAAELADSGIEVLGCPGLGVPTPWQRCAHRARRGQRRP